VQDVEAILERPGQIQSDDFVGCIHSVIVNGRHLNMSSPQNARAITDKCQRVHDLCESGSSKCGSEGQCVDLWDSYTCKCDGMFAPNCNEAFSPFSFSNGAFVEYQIGERYRRSQLLHMVYSERDSGRERREISGRKLAFNFRTVMQDSVLFYSASGKDYTMLEVCVFFCKSHEMICIFDCVLYFWFIFVAGRREFEIQL